MADVPPLQNQKRAFLSEVRFELTNVPPPRKDFFLSEVRFELTDVPPSQNEKVGFQANVTFWFWQQTLTKM